MVTGAEGQGQQGPNDGNSQGAGGVGVAGDPNASGAGNGAPQDASQVQQTQPTAPTQTQQQTQQVQPNDGQGNGVVDDPTGFISPYLENLDPSVQPVVHERLEQFRKDQDANVNRRLEQSATKLNEYEQLGDPEQLQRANSVYSWLLSDPVSAINWVVEAYEQEGVDIRGQLAGTIEGGGSEMNQPQQQVPQQGNPQGQGQQQQQQVPVQGDPNAQQPQQYVEPVTQDTIQKVVQGALNEFVQSQKQEQEAAKTQQKIDGYLNEAAERHGIPFEGDNDPLRDTMTRQALSLMQSGQTRDARVAFDLAGEALSNRLSSVGTPNGQQGAGNGQGQGQQPGTQQGNQQQVPSNAQQPVTTGQGGTTPTPPAPNLHDPKQRREAALNMWGALNQQE